MSVAQKMRDEWITIHLQETELRERVIRDIRYLIEQESAKQNLQKGGKFLISDGMQAIEPGLEGLEITGVRENHIHIGAYENENVIHINDALTETLIDALECMEIEVENETVEFKDK